MSHGIVTAACHKLGFRPTSTCEFMGRALAELADKTLVEIELNRNDMRYKVTHGERYNTGNTLAIALAGAVMDHG